jgi:hypothetical protein
MSLEPRQRLAYDDADTTAQMHADCAAAARRMRLPRRSRVSEAAVATPPSILYADYREASKPEISISEATARLAASLHLHLD